MKSIRSFLIASMLAAITLTLFLAAIHGYRSSLSEIQSLQDNSLAERARLLTLNNIQQSRTVMLSGLNEHQAFQVFRHGKLLQHSENTPSIPVTRQAGLHDINFANHRWRTYTRINSKDGTQVMTAERMDTRDALAEKIIIESVLPIISVLPLSGVLIWLIVGHGLSPLRQFARDLRQRHADDLSPIPVDFQPVELLQLVDSTNNLLHRLKASFERERRFASDAAHELRTPIAALKVHLHNLSYYLPEGNPEVDNLVIAVDRMGQLVEQILALYRTSPDHYFAQLVELDLHQLVQAVITDMYPAFEQRHIQLELIGQAIFIPCDKAALETLIKNLLDNACKYTPPGGQVRVKISPLVNAVSLTVEDSGPGVPESQRQRIFDRFYRLGGDQHASSVIGCGLGLAIVKHIAQLHNATMTVGTSSFGTGLAITISFPLDRNKMPHRKMADEEK